jgi:trimeric autotransporter adhesin
MAKLTFAAAVAIAALAVGPTTALADTGSVYIDTGLNVGAGSDSFAGGGLNGGLDNVGVSYSVMPSITTGDRNIAIGTVALSNDSTGSDNVAVGDSTLALNHAGNGNVAAGTKALFDNDGGSSNIATGFDALFHNTTGDNNAATGSLALFENTTGALNVAGGTDALESNTTGDSNVAEGVNALSSSKKGHDNLAAGFQALDAATGDRNVGLGSGAGKNLTTGSDNVDIANAGKAGESDVVRIGTKGTQKKAFLAGVSGRSIGGPAQPVLVNAQGQLGTATATASKVARSAAGGAVARLRAHVRRQDDEIAKLEREVATLSRR